MGGELEHTSFPVPGSRLNKKLISSEYDFYFQLEDDDLTIFVQTPSFQTFKKDLTQRKYQKNSLIALSALEKEMSQIRNRQLMTFKASSSQLSEQAKFYFKNNSNLFKYLKQAKNTNFLLQDHQLAIQFEAVYQTKLITLTLKTATIESFKYQRLEIENFELYLLNYCRKEEEMQKLQEQSFQKFKQKDKQIILLKEVNKQKENLKGLFCGYDCKQ